MLTSETGVFLGILGLMLSGINLWRSIKTNKNTRGLAYAQKKQEALSLVIEGEVGGMAARRQLWEIRDEAFAIGATELALEAEAYLKDYEFSITRLAEIRSGLDTKNASQLRHREHVRQIESMISEVRQIVDSRETLEELSAFIDLARRNIILRTKIAERAALETNPRVPLASKREAIETRQPTPAVHV